MYTITAAKPETPINSLSKFIFIIAGAVLFNLLFWNEKLALNACIFSGFLVAGIYHFYPTALSNNKVQWLLLASFFSLACVLWHNTVLSKLALFASLLLLSAYSQYSHNSLLYAGGSVVQSFIFFIPSFLLGIKTIRTSKKRKTGFGRKFKLVIIPLFILLIFFGFYISANEVFADMALNLTIRFQRVWETLVSMIAPQRLAFLLMGLLISGGLLVRYTEAPFEKAELKKADGLFRVKNHKAGKGFWNELLTTFFGKFATGVMALKNEYLIGVICLVLLNGLLLIVNMTDILYVWFSFHYNPGMNFTAMVHEGAETLVLSICSAMLVVLFFFRGNLNFFRKNKYLKSMAYVWITQNAVLAISVCIRNYHYIQHWGLAYKRIGLFFYVLLVFIGLVSIVIKIHARKSGYFLWRVNAMAAFMVLVFSGIVNWDVTIARYNISKQGKNCDIAFLLTMNDKVLPILEANKEWICTATGGTDRYTEWTRPETGSYCEKLAKRKADFFEAQQKYSWLSWNLADVSTKKQLLQSAD